MGRTCRAWLRSFPILAILIAASPISVHAKGLPPGPDGLPPENEKHPWIYYRGATVIDTLRFSPQDILPVAKNQFLTDHWQIFRLDPKTGEVVTLWKPMHHPLVRIFMGSIHARCTVHVRPIAHHQAQLVFEGDLVSRHDLSRNPMIGAANHQYVKAAHHYVGEVRGYLEAHPHYSSLP